MEEKAIREFSDALNGLHDACNVKEEAEVLIGRMELIMNDQFKGKLIEHLDKAILASDENRMLQSHFAVFLLFVRGMWFDGFEGKILPVIDHVKKHLPKDVWKGFRDDLFSLYQCGPVTDALFLEEILKRLAD